MANNYVGSVKRDVQGLAVRLVLFALLMYIFLLYQFKKMRT